MRFKVQGPIARALTIGLFSLLSTLIYAATPDLGLQVKEAWIRWLPANVPSGAYMTLSNTGAVPRVLVSAASPDFGEVSFHETHINNGVSEMSAVNSLTVKPRASLRFSPGGLHMMLMQPKRSLHPGDQVPITLHFADGQSLDVLFEVRAAGAHSASHADDRYVHPA
jgi:copper(I)-binding protein